jgi:DNA-binding transcriptional LysR family regulator
MPAAPRFTLEQLSILDAIVRTGSFAGASRELHKVPSAISYSVQALEEAVGVELFDRSGHRAELTPAGRQLLVEARDLLGRAQQLDRAASQLGQGWEPELRVVVDGAYPLGPVLGGLAMLVERKVPTQVQIDVEYQDGVIARFHQDHAGFMIALGLEDGGKLHGRPLPAVEMVLVAGAQHPLARKEGLQRDDLAEHVDLVVKDSSASYARTPRPAFLGSRHVIRFSDFQSKLAALRSGVGFGWMPKHLVEGAITDGALRVLDLPDGNRWTYQPQLITRRDEPPGRAAQLLIEHICAA